MIDGTVNTSDTTNQPKILVEHPDFYVVHKPALWLTHTNNNQTHPLPNVLDFYRRELAEDQLAPPHRLDRETSGAQLLSRDRESAQVFYQLFKLRLVGKIYIALVHGTPDWAEYTLDAPLGTWGIGAENKIMVRQAVVPNGKPAKTHFRVLDRRADHSLITASPHTGRMHQIRAHLSHLGLPLVGDKIYGRDPQAFLDFIAHGQTPELSARLGLPRQALHAWRVAFPWAGTQFCAKVPLADDIQEYWDTLTK